MEVGERAGGMDYTAVAMAVTRFEQKAEYDPHLKHLMQTVKTTCEK